MASITMKSVLLGSAAGILATAAAQAADLPVTKAAAVQYVKICSAYGAGFFEIPGTDMCMRIFNTKLGVEFSSAIPKDTLFLTQSTKTAAYAQTYVPAGVADYIGYTISARPGFDVRNATEYGTVRGVAQLRVDLKNGIDANVPPGGTPAATPSCYRCYIEWAGFTIGAASSAFPYLNEDDLYGALVDDKISVTIVQYSFTAPGGWSGSIGFEDPNKHFLKGQNGTAEAGLAAVGGGIAVTHGPERWWDVVGALNFKQDWGNFALRGALHQISLLALAGTGFPTACPPGAVACTGTGPALVSSGWAVQAGVTFNLPMWGAKDLVLFEAAYADGATDYVGFNQTMITGPGGSGNWAGGLQRDDHDAIAINNGDGTFRIEKEKAWQVTALLKHYWNPDLHSNVFANYAAVTPGTTTQNTDWMNGGLGKATQWAAGANLYWKSTKTTEIGVEAIYRKAKQTLASAPGAAPTPLPAGITENGSNWTFHLGFNKAW